METQPDTTVESSESGETAGYQGDPKSHRIVRRKTLMNLGL